MYPNNETLNIKLSLLTLAEDMVFIDMNQKLSDMADVCFFGWGIKEYVINAGNDDLVQHVSEVH